MKKLAFTLLLLICFGFSSEAQENKKESDRIIASYNFTTFNRKGVGPWHLISFGYVKNFKSFTIIPKINLVERRTQGNHLITNSQFEVDSYFKGKKSYQNLNIAYSQAIVFQKIRLFYSFYQSYKNAIEIEYGARYVKTENLNIYAAVLGFTKYVGNYYINIRGFAQFDHEKLNPAFSSTVRYYRNKESYWTFLAGYGSSTDERYLLGQIENRIDLNSFYGGFGYFGPITKKLKVGLQFMYNNQEYLSKRFQNEFNFFTSFSYDL